MANAQYDKFIELRKSGVDAKAARVQAYGEVAPVAPAPTDINSDASRLARLQASGGSPTAIANLQPTVAPTTPPAPVTPAPMVQAPVDQTTGLSRPLEATPAPIAPVAEVKAPEPIKQAKTEPVVDYNVSTGREQQIQDNISKITQASPNLLKDRNAYNQAFGYETADAGKKALLDSTFSGQVKPSQDDIFNSLRAGVTVGDPKSTEFRQAQARISTFKKFSTYDTASLATSLQSGDLLVGTKAYNDLVSDPTMSSKIQKAQAFNKGVVDLVKIGETQGSNIMASNPTVANALADGNLSKEEYDQLTNNEEVSAQLQKVETNKTKYETIKAQYDAVEDDVNKEFDGKEVTDSFKAKVAADRRKGMYKDYQIASLEYQNALGTYTNLKDDATALLGQNMKLYETAQAEKAQIAGEERQMKNSLALSQAQFDQKIVQQAQLMNDPATAIQSVMDEFTYMGIPTTQSIQTKVADAEKFIAQGGTLAGYIDKMRKDYMNKPEYKALSEYNKQKLAPKTDTTPFQIANLGDGKAIMYNQSTGSYNVIGSSGQPVTTQQIPSIVDECRTTGSCGQGVNDYLQKLGDTRVFGNSYTEKQAKINSEEPVVGGVAVWQPTGKMAQPEYGHVGIVTAVNGDKVTVTDWNWNGDNKQSTHTVPLSSIKANGGGFYVPKTGTQETTGFDNSKMAQYKAFYENDGKLPTGLKEGTQQADSFIKQAYAGYSDYMKNYAEKSGFKVNDINALVNMNPTEKKNFETSLDSVSNFINTAKELRKLIDENGVEATGLTSSGRSMEKAVKDMQLQAKEIYNLGVLNGPDLALMENIIQSPVGATAVWMGADEVKKSLDNVVSRFNTSINSKANRLGLEKVGATEQTSTTPVKTDKISTLKKNYFPN